MRSSLIKRCLIRIKSYNIST